MGNALAGNILTSRAWAVWESVSVSLCSACEKLMVVGSLRRVRIWCHDVDIVTIPIVNDDGYVPLHQVLIDISDDVAPAWVFEREKLYKNPNRKMVCILGLHQTQSVIYTFVDGIQLDVYEVQDENYFWPEVVVRTGPARRKGVYGPDDPGAMQNPALATRARRMGMTMSMSGHGLQRDGVRVGYQTERAFFDTLALPYCQPHLRDHPEWIARIWDMTRAPPGQDWAPQELSL